MRYRNTLRSDHSGWNDRQDHGFRRSAIFLGQATLLFGEQEQRPRIGMVDVQDISGSTELLFTFVRVDRAFVIQRAPTSQRANQFDDFLGQSIPARAESDGAKFLYPA